MKFSKNYIAMVSQSEEIQAFRKEGLQSCDYYIIKEGQEPVIKVLDGETFGTWIPRTDQLLELFPEEKNHQGGARRGLEGLNNPFHIPNKVKSYQTYNEQFFSMWMNQNHRKIWLEEIDEEGNLTGVASWHSEKQLLNEKLGIEAYNEQDTRTVPIKNAAGKEIGMRTEAIAYNFETGKIDVVNIVSDYMYPEKKKD